MPKYVIERNIPGAGKLSSDELHAISQKSCGVLNEMGPRIQWVESYVTQDKVLLRLRRAQRRHGAGPTPERVGSRPTVFPK